MAKVLVKCTLSAKTSISERLLTTSTFGKFPYKIFLLLVKGKMVFVSGRNGSCAKRKGPLCRPHLFARAPGPVRSILLFHSTRLHSPL